MFVAILAAGLLIHFFRVDQGDNKEVGYVVVILVVIFVASFAFSWG